MDYVLNIIYYPLAMLLKLCYMIVNDYGWAIILFAVIAKLLMLPISIKSEKSRLKMQKIQPKVNAIQQKYKGDTRNPKYNEEIQKLYTEEGYSPASGCLPMLIQLPLIMGLWNAIRKPLTYIFDFSDGVLQAVFTKIQTLGGLTEITNFDAVKNSQIGLLDAINNFRASLGDVLPAGYPEHVNMNFLGMNLGDTPKLEFSLALLIPIISAVTSFLVGFVQQKINKVENTGDKKGPNLNFMLYTMPIISLIMAFSFQYGIALYWITSNILSLIQVVVLAKVMKPKEKEEVVVKEKKLNYNQIEKLNRERAALEAEEKRKQELENSQKGTRKAISEKEEVIFDEFNENVEENSNEEQQDDTETE